MICVQTCKRKRLHESWNSDLKSQGNDMCLAQLFNHDGTIRINAKQEIENIDGL